MNRAVQAVVAISAILLPVVGLPQTGPNKSTKTARITGRIVSEQGNPVQDFVVVTRIEDDVLLADQALITASDGSFAFVSEPGRKYRLFLRDHALKAPVIVDTTAGSDVRVSALDAAGCCLLPRSIRTPPPAMEGGDLQPDQIIIEPQNFVQGEPWKIETLQPPSCRDQTREMVKLNPNFESDLLPCRAVCPPVLQSVFSVWGYRVKAIRVVRYDPKLTPAQIRHEVQKIWLGIGEQLIDMPGTNVWTMEALLEFDDGKRATMLMDGNQVEVKDRDGNCWFLRLWPALG